MEETTVQRHGSLVLADERSGRAGSRRWKTSNRLMLSAECQAEKYSHAIGIPAHECGHESKGERLLQSLDKGRCKTQNTTEEQECHAHEMRDR